MKNKESLTNTVIKNGYCIGCGVCTYPENSPYKIELDEFGNYVAQMSTFDVSVDDEKIGSLCPFTNNSENEDQLSEQFFPDSDNKDPYIGKYLKCYSGYVIENEFRAQGSSGGMGKWIGYKLLIEGKIDYFIQLSPNKVSSVDERLFDYKLFSNPEKVIEGSKSAYYPTTLQEVIKIIKENKGRYAITGVPCFIKGLRLLMVNYPELKDRIVFTIGVICGGMKSANQSKMIAWDLGIEPNDIASIDFRKKYKDRPATQKIYQVWSKKDRTLKSKNANDIFGTDYGTGFFTPKACNYCDDVVGELADISIGDSWLPEDRVDPNGTSLIVVRDIEILTLLTNSLINGELHLRNLEPDDVIKAQSGGFRHRRQGLSHRLQKRVNTDEWVPKKRVTPGEFTLTDKRKRMYDLRETIASQSHLVFLKALKKNDLKLFKKEMMPLVKKYTSINQGGIHIRIYNKFKNKLKRLME